MKKLIFITSLFICLTFYAQHNYDAQNVIYSHSNNQITIGSNQIHGNYSNGSALIELNSVSDDSYIHQKTANGSLGLGLFDNHDNGLFMSDNIFFRFYMFNIGDIMRFQTNGNYCNEKNYKKLV